MGRTVCNLLGNCIAAAIVGRWEQEVSAEDLKRYIDHPLTDEEVSALEQKHLEAMADAHA